MTNLIIYTDVELNSTLINIDHIFNQLIFMFDGDISIVDGIHNIDLHLHIQKRV